MTKAQPRKLGPVLATMFVTGNMVGSGLFLLPATLGSLGGISVFTWILATIGALLIAGFDTTANMIALGAIALTENPQTGTLWAGVAGQDELPPGFMPVIVVGRCEYTQRRMCLGDGRVQFQRFLRVGADGGRHFTHG